MLSGFGVFWCCEGLGAPWAGADLALPALVALFLTVGLILASWVRARRREVAA